MKLISMKCPNCGSDLQLDAESRQCSCAFCGTKILLDDEVQHHHVHYDNAEDAGYQFEKGRQRAQAEARVYAPQTVVVQNVVQRPRKRRTFWWALGWILIFPLPLTILLGRNKKMNPTLKIILVAAAWLLFFGIIMFSKPNEESDKTAVQSLTSHTCCSVSDAFASSTFGADPAENPASEFNGMKELLNRDDLLNAAIRI